MAGHSKWNNIKQKKGKTDASRSKAFTKIGRELAVAVKEGGPAPENNSKLRDVIAKAKAANMPSDSINRAIKKASGDTGGASFEEITYEGYGDGGVAVLAKCLTDNKNRSAADIRHIFDKHGNGMGVAGSVAWSFDNKGQILIDAEIYSDEDAIMDVALENGADDVIFDEGVFQILSEPSKFAVLREALETAKFEFMSADIEMIPQNTIEINEAEQSAKVQRLIDALEDNDDVQSVFHNALLLDEE